jgi:hypothetical protein
MSAWKPIVTLDLKTVSTKAFEEAISKLREHAKTNPLPEIQVKTGEVITADPQFAEKALLRNAGNRKISLAHVQDLSEAMANGEWRLAQPWLFDEEMMSQDLQHRACAVYFGGHTIQTPVLVVPKQKDLFAFIDAGRSRDAAAALYTAGLNGQSAMVSQAINLIWRSEHKALSAFKMPAMRKMTNIEVLEYARSHPQIANTAHLVAGSFPRSMTTIGAKGVAVCFAYMVLQHYDTATLAAFLEPLATGANLDEDSPILALRNRLIGAGDDDQKLSKGHRLALLIKAFNWVREAKTVGKSGLYLKDNEKFPQIVTPPVEPLPIAAE